MSTALPHPCPLAACEAALLGVAGVTDLAFAYAAIAALLGWWRTAPALRQVSAPRATVARTRGGAA